MSEQQDPGSRLTSAIDAMTGRVDATTDWSRQSPCDDWNAHQVLDHVTDTLQGIIGMLSGGSYRDSKHGDAGRTATPEEAITRWRDLAEQAKRAAGELDPGAQLNGPMGPGPADQALAIPTHDLTVHAWDLSAAAGSDWEIPEGLRADLDQLVHSTSAEVLRSPGLFEPEVEAPAGAGPTEQLMAFLGRKRP